MRITDFAVLQEIKDEYAQMRQDGKDRTSATEALCKEYHDELTAGSNDDGLLFWIGLADAQYARKELSSEVAARAISALNAIEASDYRITPGDIARRREHYAKAPMPERSKVGTRKKFHYKWEIGDTFAYMLSGKKAEELGVAGEYILLRKVDEVETSDGRILPIVTLTHWRSPVFPVNSEEFLQAPMLKLACNRLGTLAGRYEYRVEILYRRERELNGLKYLGRFSNVTMPEDEVVIHGAGYILMIHPERFADQCCTYLKKHRYYLENMQPT